MDNDVLVIMYDDQFAVYSLTERRMLITEQMLYQFDAFKLVPSLHLLLTSTDDQLFILNYKTFKGQYVYADEDVLNYYVQEI